MAGESWNSLARTIKAPKEKKAAESKSKKKDNTKKEKNAKKPVKEETREDEGEGTSKPSSSRKKAKK